MSAVPPTGRNSVWFFLFLGVAAPSLLVTLILVNHYQQLTPERLAGARAVWQEKGPRDYVLEYAIKRDDNPDPVQRTPEKYTVRVKDGMVEKIIGPDGKPPPRGDFEFGSMDDLFNYIERQLQADREAGGPLPFVKAEFQPASNDFVPGGFVYVSHYVHYVSQAHKRLEVSVTKFTPLTASPP